MYYQVEKEIIKTKMSILDLEETLEHNDKKYRNRIGIKNSQITVQELCK